MKVKHIVFFLSFLSAYSLGFAQIKPALFSSVDERAMHRWVDSVFNTMTPDERIGQLFMIIVEPVAETKNMTRVANLIHKQKIGGILFQKGDPESQVIVTNRVQNEARIPLMIALDGEWGLSMRLNNTTRFPKNMMIGAVADLTLIEQYGEEVGRQCREMGIHVNFAPVADVNSNPENPVIGIRSFGEDPADVASKTIAFSRGLEKAGIISVAKHFPGHGDTQNDSHNLLPTIQHSNKRLNNVELYPFKQYINSGLSGIMTAHLNIPALGTDGRPSSLSYQVVTDLLRNQMEFEGLCFTDGLAMKGAVVGKNENLAVQALIAGNDILLGPVDPEKDFEAVKQAVKAKQLNMSDIDNRCRRILCYKYIAGLNHITPLALNALDERLNTPRAKWLNARLNAEAISVVKNDNDLIPIRQLDRKRIAAVSLGGANEMNFHRMLKRYTAVDCYNMPNNTSNEEKKKIFNRLEAYDMIICSVHDNRSEESRELEKLAATKEFIYTFFTLPYRCTVFQSSIQKAQAVVIAYEPTSSAENYAAQVLFGGIPAIGSLPVSIPELFPLGTGILTEKTRLGFHQPEEAGANPYNFQAIDTIIREGLEKEAYPGGQLLIAKDGLIIYHKTFGYYDFSKQQKVTENTVYDLASVSKATGTLLAVMKSYDDGNFQLTHKISQYVPELKETDKKNIIIRDLLYHQSGLPATIAFYTQAIDKNSYTGSLFSNTKDAAHPVQFDTRTFVNTNYKYDPALVSTVEKTGFKTQVARDFFIHDSFAYDSIVSGIANSRMSASGRYVYSCINFILLKMMVEKQTKENMDAFLQKNFFSPLGATSTTYNPLRKMDVSLVAPSENDRFVRRQSLQGYVHDEAAAFQGGVSGNAGLFSNAFDLAKIMQLYLDNGMYGGERYLSEKTCRMFTGSKSPVSRRGLGFDKPDARNPQRSPCGLLAPQAVYGHTGYTGTCFWIDPENNMFFIFLCNRTYPTRMNGKLFALDIRTRIQDEIYKSLELDAKEE